MDIPVGELTAVAICVLLSVLFSGSETALNALGISRLEKYREKLNERHNRHRFLEIWAERRNEALICILIGNNVVNITASALATQAFQKLFGVTEYANLAIPVAIFVTTFVILTFGEIIPKTYAQNNPERFTSFTRVLYPIWGLLKPVTWFFTRMSESFIRRTGGSVLRTELEVTEEDIEGHIEKAVEQGHLDEEQRDMLESVLDLDDVMVRDVMRPRTRMTAIPDSATLPEVLETIKASSHSRYPVYGENLDDIKGVLYVRDLIQHVGKPHTDEIQLSQFFRAPFRVPDTMKLHTCIKSMQLHAVHLAIVMDEHGQVAGLVTVEDIVEEVFGEIYDEHDTEERLEELIVVVAEGSAWEIMGEVAIHNLEDAVGIQFPEEHDTYTTVAGFIVQQAETIPKVGFEARLFDHLFTVLEADEKRVIRVRITLEPVEIQLEHAVS